MKKAIAIKLNDHNAKITDGSCVGERSNFRKIPMQTQEHGDA